jgi:F0F1-type ATP synthase membrane subunit c/vacuolar-type H+-ATPase subunit K
MSNQSRASRAEESEANTAQREPSSLSKAASIGRKVAKGTGKALWFGTALDVLNKDVRRVKPLNPGLWRDVFSPKGWQAAKNKFKGQGADPPTLKGKSKGAAKGIASAIFCAVSGIAIAIYGFEFATSATGEPSVPTINKIIAIMLTATGLIYGMVHAAITVLLVSKTFRGLATSKKGVKQ